MSDEIGRVRCPFCLKLGAVCRARQVERPWHRCCTRCKCSVHAVERPPAPTPWIELGVGGAPIHPKKCSATMLHPALNLETGKKHAAMGCMHCGATEYYRTAMKRRARGVLETHGVEVTPAA